ncbi:MAG: hypothetical protein HKN03_06965 [Acidimicrobiales bacterium]|nr:hypothetical protein [Acidimicrobiales bacterium]
MGTIFAVILAGVLLWAAVAKFRDPSGTADGFQELGLPRAHVLAILVPVAEAATAITLLALPGWGGVVSFALLAAFTVVLVTTIRIGRLVPCRCFGGTSDSPVTWRHVFRNLQLMGMAVFASLQDRLQWPSVLDLVVAVSLLGVGAISIRSFASRSTVTT